MYQVTITTDRTGKQALTMYQTFSPIPKLSNPFKRIDRSGIGDSKLDSYIFSSINDVDAFCKLWLKTGRNSWRTSKKHEQNS